ncbi:MAG TPA: acetyl-CoA hydrolase/transferase C-terminal domain-containing protein, partial [Steroidobacteraceae bacterium]|nr:acetyl-CoA hydrolase/transferase C-terminal domain-containing protein [Steroidobacteraceae bacterium]
LPANVRVIEFYLAPGGLLHSPSAQQNYLSANYTHVARDVMARGVNVIAHLLAARRVNGELELSFGSNADVTPDLLPAVAAARRAGHDIVLVGETHAQMPFMGGHARVAASEFDYLVDDPRYDFDLYAPPNAPLSSVEHAIGLHASSLVRDGGTLQVGIGEMGDAVVYALLLRHQQNALWRATLAQLAPYAAPGPVGCDAPFAAGLFASSEMFVDTLLELYRAGVLRRRVYDYLPLERLLARGQGERFDAQILAELAAVGAGPRLSAQEFATLRHYGVFREEVEYRDGRVCAREGQWLAADLGDPAARSRLAAECLGRSLRNGQVMHAGFFLGPRGFYAALRELPESERAQFGMRGVAYVNQLYGADQELRVLQRRAARFINTTMMVTLLGAAVSDQLEDGQVVSGVGGQYNFVAMAHALPDARSILCVRATRTHQGRTTSNIVWNYAHETIPRHLRDLVITEYGIADLRGRTDEEVIAALLNVADSRFQDELLARARAAGKIRGDYRIPAQFRANLPRRLAHALRPLQERGFFSEYPFGTDLTAEEVALARALKFLEAHTAGLPARLRTLAAALGGGRAGARHAGALQRMGLERPRGLTEWVQRRLLVLALEATAAAKDPA